MFQRSHDSRSTEALVTETILMMAKRHVREGAARIRRLRMIISDLECDAHHEVLPRARETLAAFLEVQTRFEQNLRRVIEDGAGSTPVSTIVEDRRPLARRASVAIFIRQMPVWMRRTEIFPQRKPARPSWVDPRKIRRTRPVHRR